MEELGQVWVKERSWVRLLTPKRCRSMGKGYIVCGKSANYAFMRSNGLWAYCEEHMYGRRIRDGIVEVSVSADSPAAKQGYVD